MYIAYLNNTKKKKCRRRYNNIKKKKHSHMKENMYLKRDNVVIQLSVYPIRIWREGLDEVNRVGRAYIKGDSFL